MTTHEIKMKIREEEELFSSFDPEQKQLSEDVISYLTRNYINKHRSGSEKYVIRISSDTPVNEDHIRDSFREFFIQEENTLKYSLKRLTMKEICLGILGIIFLSIWLFLSVGSDNLNLEILSIMGWVTIWEAAGIAFMQRPELKKLQRGFEHMLNADIVFEICN